MISQTHVPSEFLCPITVEIMEDPVILADGRSYERAAIQQWLTSSKRSPMTGAELEHTSILPNVNLKALIEDWRNSQTVSAAIREEETALQEMPRSELEALRRRMQDAFRQTDGMTLVIERAQVVYNERSKRSFEYKVAELRQLRGSCQVVTRFHGTTSEAAAGIALHGFKLPVPDADGDFVGKGLRVFYTEEQRETTQEHANDLLMFGQAVYVSTDLEKSTRFAQGAIILCQCALGKELQKRGAEHNLTWTAMQERGFDSVRALANCQENGGCKFEEHALYHADQILPTHVIHFRLVKTGVGSLAAQQLSRESQVLASQYSLETVSKDLIVDINTSTNVIDATRIQACKTLGDLARDDQQKAIKKFLSDRKLVSRLACCARSPNEALQFEALRSWWNFSFNDPEVQLLALGQLGVALLVSLLDSPNVSLRQRAVGLIWNLTQHSEDARKVFTEAGVVKRLALCLSKEVRDIISSASPPWGMAQLVSGALANIALTCASDLKSSPELVEAGSSLVGMNLVAPDAVQQQATRMLCNIISDGKVDPIWQANDYCYRTSAPKEGMAVIA